MTRLLIATVAWALPATAWWAVHRRPGEPSALALENDLLSGLLTGRLRPDHYRDRIAELARRCDHPDPMRT